VSKTFGVRGAERRVLREVSCRVAAGELASLTGANAAGKSTLLRIVATLVKPDSGSVELLGHPITHRQRAQLGFATGAERSFQLSLSAKSNLLFWGELCGISRRTLLPRVEELSEMLGVESALQAPVAEASQGTRDRLALVRALLHRPQLLLLDEPTRSQDLNGRRRIVQVLRQFAEGGGAALIATHEPTVFGMTRVNHLEQGCLSVRDALTSAQAAC
jgi:ABC-type multidrug transport system ATPase subunit